MKKSDKVRVSLKLAKNTGEMIDEIAGKMGFLSKSTAISFAIADTHMRMFPKYLRNKKK